MVALAFEKPPHCFPQWLYQFTQVTLMTLVVMNPPAKAGDIRDMGSILESGRSPGEGNVNPV